jgi:transposase-like protein
MTTEKHEYTRRLQRSEHSPNFADDKDVRDMLLQLDQLERQTDPQHPDGEYDKDASANKALRIVSDLCDYVSGWAMDHKIGLAIEGIGNIPDLPARMRTPDYDELRKSASSHRHEAAGQSRDLTSGVQRKALSNIFNAIAASRRETLFDPLAEALQALEFGERLPLFQAPKDGRKRQFRELRLQLYALCFIEYKDALGSPKNELQSEVAETFGVSFHTVRGWDRQLRTQLDPFYLANALSRARICGEADRENDSTSFDRFWGRAALSEWGAQFKSVQRLRKAQK